MNVNPKRRKLSTSSLVDVQREHELSNVGYVYFISPTRPGEPAESARESGEAPRVREARIASLSKCLLTVDEDSTLSTFIIIAAAPDRGDELRGDDANGEIIEEEEEVVDPEVPACAS